jgi:hypothetical protein
VPPDPTYRPEPFLDMLDHLRDAGDGDEVSIVSGDPDDHPVPEAGPEPLIEPGGPPWYASERRGLAKIAETAFQLPVDAHMGD